MISIFNGMWIMPSAILVACSVDWQERNLLETASAQVCSCVILLVYLAASIAG